MITTVAIQQIRTDGGTQPRAEIRPEVVQEYSEAIQSGVKLPPMVVFFDGKDYWLADGFHRRGGYELANIVEVEIDQRDGTVRDAILYSVGANADHGIRRNSGDKRRAVEKLLRDGEWGARSNVWIAEHCHCTEGYVRQVRLDIKETPDGRSTTTLSDKGVSSRTGRDGKQYRVPSKPEPQDSEDDGISDEDISEAYTVPSVKQSKPDKENAPVTAAALPDDDLTDDEYLRRCPAYRRLMQFPHRGREFKVNALAYRSMSESIPGKPTLLGQVKHAVGRSFDTAATGPFYDLAARFANVKPPQEWPLCVKCQGKLVVFANTGDHTGSGPEIVCKGCTGGYTL